MVLKPNLVAQTNIVTMFNRRSFIKNSAFTLAASLTLPEIAAAGIAAENSKKLTINANDVVLFQGDSITDWGRDKNKTEANNSGSLGNGYAFLTASDLLLKYAGKGLQIYNKGISGNKVYQLAERWDNDCLSLKPNVLSILVGVNDFWHTLTSGYKGTIETYRTDYKKLLDRTQKALPDVQFIIGEPFAVKGVKSVDDSWYPAFDQYRQAARDIAAAYNAAFIPYQSIFDKAVQTAPGSYWTFDGVHPSIAGTQLMAHAWMETVK